MHTSLVSDWDVIFLMVTQKENGGRGSQQSAQGEGSADLTADGRRCVSVSGNDSLV